MKKTFTFFFIICFLISFGQKNPSEYMKETYKYLSDNDYDKAKKNLIYIVNHFPHHTVYYEAYFNLGILYFEQKEYHKAENIFKKITNSNISILIDTVHNVYCDPYKYYKNEACRDLCTIYYERGNYEKALHYHALSDTVFKFYHLCGNAHSSYAIYKAETYSKIYQKLNQPEKAIEKLLPHVFPNYMSSNEEIIADLLILLKNKPNILQELDSAIANMYTKKTNSHNYDSTVYCIRFQNVEIEIICDYFFLEDILPAKKQYNAENVTEFIKASDFYIEIQNINQ